MIVNGIIMDQLLAAEIFRIGFEHLKSVSPFNRGTVIYSQRSNVWRAYLLEENKEFIKPTDEDGQFEIDFRAKEFVSLVSGIEFLQINAGIKSFNHLKAIEFFQNPIT